ncbi:MAG TPA: type II secretion system protein [Nitrosospira sp.]|nr:type II secretion system protein [Nitrosospira sp.]
MDAERGYTYIWILFSVALAGIVLATAGQVWQTEAWREKEVELMFVGEQFRQAIESYYESSPGTPKRYPDTLERLLADDRFPTVRRHLRKIFFDPMTGKSEWALIQKPGVGIIGVHSLSSQKPFKRANFPARYEAFADAVNYQDWEFIYLPGEARGAPAQQPQPTAQADPQSQSPIPRSTPQPEPKPGESAQPQPEPSPFSPGAGESPPFPLPAGP